jgi:hypothetical protein
MRHSLRKTFENERGSVLLIAVLVVAITSLLGVALFELSTIEAGLVTRGDVGDAQAFYCAEAGLTYTYKSKPKTDEILALAAGATKTYTYADLSTKYGSYTVSVVATGSATSRPTITATCTQANQVTRTVQVGLAYPNSIYEFPVVSGNATAPLTNFGNFYLGGTGTPMNSGGAGYVGGSDHVFGDIYASNKAALRGDPVLTPCFSSDCDPTNKNPQLTAVGGLLNNSTFVASAPGAYGNTGLNPMPDVNKVVSDIRSVVGGQMTGVYNGSTVYNLTKIFQTLGVCNQGNTISNLCKPSTPGSNCSFGQATTDPNCQVWQDLLFLNIKQSSADPGPKDLPSYYFMGIPSSLGSNKVQGTAFTDIYSAILNASGELGQMGFTSSNLSLRLNNLAGQDTGACNFALNCADNILRNDGKSIDALVDLTVGMNFDTSGQAQAQLRNKAPIFFIDDGYFRVDGATNFAFNGIGTIITSQSIIISDNLIYLNGNANKNIAPPPGSCSNINDRTNCGAADVLGLVAQNDIWIGDAGGNGQSVEWASGVMTAGRDFNYFDYTSGSICCQGPPNPVTLNGTAMAARQVSMARDWSDPTATDPTKAGCGGGSGCKPVQIFPEDETCGVKGCWRYMTLDPSSHALIPDPNYPTSFDACETACLPGQRQITHRQLNVNYERRLWHNSALIPPGLPTGNSTLAPTLAAGTWKDCGSNPACP